MPIAKLEFNLPEESAEFRLCNAAGEQHSALYEIDMLCRGIIKHGHQYKTVEELAENIRNMMPDSLYNE